MALKNQTTPVNCIFGEGAPVGTAETGTEWIDTLTDTFYKYYGGAWHAISGGGGGGSGLPYTDNFGNWYVYPPGGFYIIGGVDTVDPTYGADIYIQAGKAASGISQYGGELFLYGGLAYGTYGYGGNVTVSGGNSLGTHGFGGALILGGGNGPDRDGFIIMLGLPILNPGGSGRVWNNGGVLNIT